MSIPEVTIVEGVECVEVKLKGIAKEGPELRPFVREITGNSPAGSCGLCPLKVDTCLHKCTMAHRFVPLKYLPILQMRGFQCKTK